MTPRSHVATAVETTAEGAETGASGATPLAPVSAAQMLDERSALVHSLGDIPDRIATVQTELQRTNSRLAGVLEGPEREKLHGLRRTLRDKLADLEEDRTAARRRIEEIDQWLKAEGAQHALESYQNAQAAGATVAHQIGETLEVLAKHFRRWLILEREAQVARDTVRSLAPGRFQEMTTYTWSTGIDQGYAGAIGKVLGEYERAAKEKAKREGRAVPLTT